MTARIARPRALLLASVLALAAAGCGVETASDGASSPSPTAADTSGSDTTEATPSPSDTTDESAPDDTTEDTTDDTATDETVPDDELTVPEVPEGFDEDTFRDSLALGFESAGLTEEQAQCVADGYIEEFGTDTGSATDYTAMLDLFTACDVDLMDLGG